MSLSQEKRAARISRVLDFFNTMGEIVANDPLCVEEEADIRQGIQEILRQLPNITFRNRQAFRPSQEGAKLVRDFFQENSRVDLSDLLPGVQDVIDLFVLAAGMKDPEQEIPASMQTEEIKTIPLRTINDLRNRIVGEELNFNQIGPRSLITRLVQADRLVIPKRKPR